MAEKKAKTAQRENRIKHHCPSCGAESRVVYLSGFGKKGFFWMCDNSCGYVERSR